MKNFEKYVYPTSVLQHVCELQYDDAREQGFEGYDPFDGLNSPLFRLRLFQNKPMRLTGIQFFKLCPINFRKLFFIKPGVNPKGLALYLSGVSLLEYPSDVALDLKDMLMRSATVDEHRDMIGWGYNFDWQNRVFFIPKHTPTVVNTSFAAHALMDYFEAYGDTSVLDVLPKIANFYSQGLNHYEDETGVCLSYTPIDFSRVYNANLLAAGALARMSKYVACDLSLANDIVSFTLNRQRKDGSWVYGENAVQGWIDSFHTGFNIEALSWVEKSKCYNDGDSLRSHLDSALRYYKSNFFESDGACKYFNNSLYPIDTHSCAQAIITLSKFKEPFAEQVMNWTLTNMYRDGRYSYRISRFWRNDIFYRRWCDAWMFHATAVYLSKKNENLG